MTNIKLFLSNEKIHLPKRVNEVSPWIVIERLSLMNRIIVEVVSPELKIFISFISSNG